MVVSALSIQGYEQRTTSGASEESAADRSADERINFASPSSFLATPVSLSHEPR